jgi:hypothetical protein
LCFSQLLPMIYITDNTHVVINRILLSLYTKKNRNVAACDFGNTVRR